MHYLDMMKNPNMWSEKKKDHMKALERHLKDKRRSLKTVNGSRTISHHSYYTSNSNFTSSSASSSSTFSSSSTTTVAAPKSAPLPPSMQNYIDLDSDNEDNGSGGGGGGVATGFDSDSTSTDIESNSADMESGIEGGRQTNTFHRRSK
jgi:hypothetical protein